MVQCVLTKYGVDRTQHEIAEVLKTREDKGTQPSKMVEYLRKVGLHAMHVTPFDPGVGIKDVEAGRDVIVDLLCYGCGHYCCLVGQTRNNWLFIDPYAELGYGFVPKADFLARWPSRFGIVVSGPPSDTMSVRRIPA